MTIADAALARFLRYVQIDTQSDPDSLTVPSTEKQKDLGRLLVSELLALGVSDAELDAKGYVYAHIEPTPGCEAQPAICLCAHMDTSPDCSGTGVKPLVHANYHGQDITLPDDPSVVLTALNEPHLLKKMGHRLVTASGTTLLGADNKAGVAEIMTIAEELMKGNIRHGRVCILFTPDEEIGRGADHVDLERLGADFGYTFDGEEVGTLEDETWNAQSVTITITGISAHPGMAKGKLVNAIKIAGEILNALPKNEWSPETTEGIEGFVHPVSLNGIAEKATIGFIVRDFKTATLAEHHDRLSKIAEGIVSKYPTATMEYVATEQYRNMKDILLQHPQVAAYAAEAIQRAGLTVKKESIRGGTDGSRLSYIGLPCPNIFTGMQNIHSKLEWVGVNDMVKAVETLVHLSQVWEEKS